MVLNQTSPQTIEEPPDLFDLAQVRAELAEVEAHLHLLNTRLNAGDLRVTPEILVAADARVRHSRRKVDLAEAQERERAGLRAWEERDQLAADIAAFESRTAELERKHEAALAAIDAYNSALAAYNADVEALTRRGQAIGPRLTTGEIEAGTGGVGGGIRVGALGTAWVGVCRQSALSDRRGFYRFSQPTPPAPVAPPPAPTATGFDTGAIRRMAGSLFQREVAR